MHNDLALLSSHCYLEYGYRAGGTLLISHFHYSFESRLLIPSTEAISLSMLHDPLGR